MQRLQVSCAVRRIYTSLNAKGLKTVSDTNASSRLEQLFSTVKTVVLPWKYRQSSFTEIKSNRGRDCVCYRGPSKRTFDDGMG